MQLYFVILSSMFVSRTYEIPSFVFVFSTSDKTPQDATRRHKTPQVRIFWDCCDFKEFTPKISDVILQNRSCMN